MVKYNGWDDEEAKVKCNSIRFAEKLAALSQRNTRGDSSLRVRAAAAATAKKEDAKYMAASSQH